MCEKEYHETTEYYRHPLMLIETSAQTILTTRLNTRTSYIIVYLKSIIIISCVGVCFLGLHTKRKTVISIQENIK